MIPHEGCHTVAASHTQLSQRRSEAPRRLTELCIAGAFDFSRAQATDDLTLWKKLLRAGDQIRYPHRPLHHGGTQWLLCIGRTRRFVIGFTH